MHHSRKGISKFAQSSSNALMILGICLGLFSLQEAISAQEAPSKQFTRENVPIGWILNEWYEKSGKQTPMYVCVCTRSICDTSPVWPFRQFFIGETIPALGPTNKNGTEQKGFVCGAVNPNDLPLRGIGG